MWHAIKKRLPIDISKKMVTVSFAKHKTLMENFHHPTDKMYFNIF